MKRITLAVVLALVAAPAAAQAKAGVEFETYPDTAKLGQQIKFTVMAIDEQPPAGGNPRPIEGRRPLLTFRSHSGRVLRVRATMTDLNGIAHGRVAFPDPGPWTTALKIGHRIEIGADRSGPIRVGVGLTQTSPAAAPPRAAPTASRSGGFPLAWLLSLAAIGSALLVLVVRRRGHWGAA